MDRAITMAGPAVAAAGVAGFFFGVGRGATAGAAATTSAGTAAAAAASPVAKRPHEDSRSVAPLTTAVTSGTCAPAAESAVDGSPPVPTGFFAASAGRKTSSGVVRKQRNEARNSRHTKRGTTFCRADSHRLIQLTFYT